MDDLEFNKNSIDSMNRTIEISSKIDEFELGSNCNPYTLALRQTRFDDDKEMKKFIKSCEYMIRKSSEYKSWTDYIREVLGVLSCDLTKESHNECHCDIHHHPVALYTIVKGIITKCIESGEPFCSADIVTKVLELHFQNRIGFISLIRSVHEKFHNGFLQLPIRLVHGDYRYFINNFCGYLEDSDLEVIESRLSIDDNNCGFIGYWTKNNYMQVDNKEKLE